MSSNKLNTIGAHVEANKLAVLLDMSVRFIKDQIKAGEMEGYRLGNRLVVPVRSVQAFLDARRLSDPTGQQQDVVDCL